MNSLLIDVVNFKNQIRIRWSISALLVHKNTMTQSRLAKYEHFPDKK